MDCPCLVFVPILVTCMSKTPQEDSVAVIVVAVPTMLGAVPVVHLVPATASAGSQELIIHVQVATAVQRPHSSVGAFFSLSISSKK